MFLARGSRVNATNMGEDIPLHLAAAHGHLDVVLLLIKSKSDINAQNEHGNTPLHYACFWGYQAIAEELVAHGALGMNHRCRLLNKLIFFFFFSFPGQQRWRHSFG